MENKRNFKVLLTGKDGRTYINRNTTDTSTTGEPTAVELPVKKIESVLGLTSANANGEATTKKPIKVATRKTNTNPKGSGTKPKLRDKSFYPNHVFNYIDNVIIVLNPNSKVVIEDYTDFIYATQDENRANDIVDILPPLYDLHFKLLQDVDTRFMIGDEVRVNFKYRSTIELKAILQKETRTIKEIKLVNLKNMTVVVAYLNDNDFFPINELDHVKT
jgi:hypothetical protein